MLYLYSDIPTPWLEIVETMHFVNNPGIRLSVNYMSREQRPDAGSGDLCYSDVECESGRGERPRVFVV